MRPLYSELNRKLAVKLTCQTLADLIRQDADLVHSVMEACRQEAARLQQPDPSRLQDLRAQYERLSRPSLQQVYSDTLERCKLDRQGRPPRADQFQVLVTAWRVLRGQRR